MSPTTPEASPTIVCPSCKKPFPLTESVAEAAIAERLEAARAGLIEDAGKQARAAMSHELERAQAEVSARDQMLRDRDQKLAAARDKELEVLRLRDQLVQQKQELELQVQRRLGEETGRIREEAQLRADEMGRFKLAEKEKIISDMTRQLEEAKRKAEQGSQQLQGEILELAFEAQLRAQFPGDTIEPVPKGEFGGDVVHRVIAPTGQPIGMILWELKRTKAFSQGWLPTLKDNQRAAKADVAILVTEAMPKGMTDFGMKDGVWVTPARTALPLAMVLRQLLTDVAAAHKASDGLETKMEQVYRYLTGPRFQQRLRGIVDAFRTMRDDLERERRVFHAQWAKREKELERVMLAATGIYGDLEGIAGQTLSELGDLDMQALTPPVDDATS